MSVNKHYKSYAEHLYQGGYQPDCGSDRKYDRVKLTNLAKVMIALIIIGTVYAIKNLL